jgi:thiol:disulfide interchange protein DsbD
VIRILALLALAAPSFAQKLDPIQWTLTPVQAKAAPGQSVVLKLTATMGEGWHLYSVTTPAGGPIPTSLKLAENPALSGAKLYQSKPARKFDPNFQLDTETFEKQVDFYFVADLAKTAAAGSAEIAANLRYQACTERECLPPRKKTVTATITVDPAAPQMDAQLPQGYTEVKGSALAGAAAAFTGPPPSGPAAPVKQAEGLGTFLLTAFGFGLAAIFTPCVFPMIPITVSFFLQQKTASRAQSVTQAIVFCLGIIGLFTALGLGVTALMGPFGVVQLASNPWVNTFIAAIFLVFGLSLLGAFEITIPSSVLTKLNSASERGGFVGTLLMGLTFSLAAFACVGPFVGTLLAASVQGDKLQPALGMLFFAMGLALPFLFLAMFPTYLNNLPRAGMWMARVKIVMGFVILAAMLKYLSNIDQVLQWNWLSRERFLAAWFVLFVLPGLYLLGLLRMEGIKADDKLGVGRTLLASAFLIFAVSLLPGMFGAPLGELDAYVPVITRPVSGGASVEQAVWMKNQYKEALAIAKRDNKLLFINFTGYACTNCHWMKANMFPRPEIASALKGFVLLELYTDGTDGVSEENQKLQESRFQTVAIPYYVILDGDEKVVAAFPGLTKNPQEFLAFLKTSPATEKAAL